MKYPFALIVAIALSLAVHKPASAATAYAGEFLAVGAGARPLALGNSFVALVDDATAGYWNAAALSRLGGRQLHVMHGERFSGLVNQDFVALAVPSFAWFDGASVSLLRLGVDDIQFTTLSDPTRPLGSDNRPVAAGTASSADYALYFSGSRQLAESLNVGASLKGIYRTVDTHSAYGFGLDVALLYHLRPGVDLAANIRDVTTTPVVWDTDTTDSIRPSVLVGIAVARTIAGGRANVAIGSRSGGDASDASGTEPIEAGIEFVRDKVALRAGMEESRQTFGIGLQPRVGLQLDVAYLQHDELEATYFLSATFGF